MNYLKNPTAAEYVLTEVEQELIELYMPDTLNDSRRYELDNLAETRLKQVLELFLSDRDLTAHGAPDLRVDIESNLLDHTTDTETGHIDDRFISSLRESIAVAQHLGIENIIKLHHEADIVNLDYRSTEQYDLLLKVLDKDRETIDRLREGDVTIVFVDEMGDYNGAMKDLSKVFATASKRTLCFGVLMPDSIDKIMRTLHANGVSPSTFVLAAHGSPGRLRFGKGRSGFDMVGGINNPYITPDTLPDDQHLLDNVKEWNSYMQRSKNVDDNKDASGRTRFILIACDQAVPVEVFEYVKPPDSEGGGNTKGQMVSVGRKSTAAVFAEKADSKHVDVFSMKVSAGVAPTADGRGIQFVNDGPDGFQSITEEVVHHYVDENGRVVEVNTKQLLLSKEPAPERRRLALDAR